MGVTIDVSGAANALHQLTDERLNAAKTAMATQTAVELNDNGTGVVPKNLGDLRDSATPNDEGVDYSTPYARAQFNGGYTRKDGTKVEFHHYTEPGTGPHWDEAIQANSQKMARIRQAYLKGLGL